MHARLVWIALGLIGVVAITSKALAQDHDDDDKGYIAGKLALGLGGAAKLDVEGQDAGDDDMKMSYGLNAAYIHALHGPVRAGRAAGNLFVDDHWPRSGRRGSQRVDGHLARASG
jgi:hypothetical protein